MATLGTMLVKLGADVRDFTAGMKKVQTSMSKMTNEIKKTADNVKRDFTKIQTKVSSSMAKVSQVAQKTAQDVGKPFSNFKVSALGAISAVNTAVAGMYIGKGIQYNADMETALMSFETLLGSAEKADAMVKDLQKFGMETPFEFKGLQDSAKLMLAMGFQAKDIMPNMKAIGNAVSAIGGNSETLNGVTMALGQMLTKGKVSAEEMNQLAERGIPAWDLLSQAMGKPKVELMKLAEQGKLYSDQALPLMLNQMNKRYEGAMDRQSKTFSGMMSNLKDNADMTLGALTKPLFDNLKTMLPIAIDFMEKIQESFKANGLKGILEQIFSKPIATAIYSIGTAIGQLFKLIIQNWSIIEPILIALVAGLGAFKALSVISTIITAVKGLGAVFTGLAGALGISMGWLIAIIGIVVALAVGVYMLIKHWDKVKAFFVKLWEGVKAIFKSAFDVLKFYFLNFTPLGLIIKHWNTIVNVFKFAWELIKAIFRFAIDFIMGWLESWGIIDYFNNIWVSLQFIWNLIATFLIEVWNRIASVATTIWNSIVNFLTSVWNSVVAVAQSVWSTITSIWNSIRSVVTTIASAIWSVISAKFNAVKAVVTSIFDSVQNSIKDKLEKARDIVKGIIDKIKGLFNNAGIKFPNIPLPHLKVTGKWSFNPPRVPSFGVDWYAKGGVFNGASVIGVGERGAEAVVPLTSSRMLPFASAIADNMVKEGSNMGTGTQKVVVEVPVYLDGKVIAKVTAPHINTELNQINKQKQRARGVFE